MDHCIFVIAHAWYVIGSPKTLNNATIIYKKVNKQVRRKIWNFQLE